jgi:hypothetical protein
LLVGVLPLLNHRPAAAVLLLSYFFDLIDMHREEFLSAA